MSQISLPIYFDYMATTPVDPTVAEAMHACLMQSGTFGNPASQTHQFGYQALQCVQTARAQVAELMNADAREIVWTSGATEADNLAIKGAATFYQRKGKHLITMSTEHKAVVDTMKYLATQGFDVTFLDPEPNGLLDLNKLESALRDDTILVSIMHVNNETGIIQDIAAIGELLRARGILFHSDAAQSAGKLDIDLSTLNVDLMSFSGHKIYGPKGIGALYVRRTPRVRLEAQMHGGGHEQGMRSGTLATHQIVGMGEAFRIAKEKMSDDCKRISKMRDRLWKGVSQLEGLHLHGDEQQRVSGCLNFSVDGVDAERLLLSLPNLAISSTSACSSGNPSPSHVLLAMGISPEEANRSIRMSVGRFTTDEQVDYAIDYFCREITKLRESGSLWKTG